MILALVLSQMLLLSLYLGSLEINLFPQFIFSYLQVASTYMYILAYSLYISLCISIIYGPYT